MCHRWFCSYLSHSKAALPAGHHFVPFVMQHVHEAIWLVLTNKLWDVGGEWGVLREANPVACQWEIHSTDSLFLCHNNKNIFTSPPCTDILVFGFIVVCKTKENNCWTETDCLSNAASAYQRATLSLENKTGTWHWSKFLSNARRVWQTQQWPITEVLCIGRKYTDWFVLYPRGLRVH